MFDERTHYPIHTMRIADDVWQELRLFKFHKKITWNKLMRYFLEKEARPAQDN